MKEKKSVIKKLMSKIIRHYLDNDPDAMFDFFRFFKPNISLGSIGFVTRFTDVQEALLRSDIFRVTYAPMMDPSVGPFMLARDNSTINQRDKGIMLSILSRDDLPAVRELMRGLAENTLLEIKDKKRIELVSEFSRVIPALFTEQYVGFKGCTVEQLQAWSMATQMDMFHNPFGDKKIHQESIDAGKSMREYLTKLLEEKRNQLNHGGAIDDVFDKVISTYFPDSIGFDDGRILSNMMGLLVGGIETTGQAVTQILNEILDRPKVLAMAIEAAKCDDTEKIFRICWEALRFNPINSVIVRRVVNDYTIGKGTLRSHTFKAGTKILIATRSAMKDKKQLHCPKEFVIDRPDYHYLHSGFGLHTCLGDQMVKVQVPEMVRAVLLLPNIRQASAMQKGRGGFPTSMTIEFN